MDSNDNRTGLQIYKQSEQTSNNLTNIHMTTKCHEQWVLNSQ